jgi:predicted secreted protein
MARISGKSGNVTVAASDVTGIKSWTLDQTFDALEGTAFDSSGHRTYIPGLDGWSGSFEGYKNGAPLTIGTEIALVLEESETATQVFSGQAIITGFNASTGVDGLSTYSYTFQGTGALTIATT